MIREICEHGNLAYVETEQGRLEPACEQCKTGLEVNIREIQDVAQENERLKKELAGARETIKNLENLSFSLQSIIANSEGCKTIIVKNEGVFGQLETNDLLRAERDRYREALERIEKMTGLCEEPCAQYRFTTCIDTGDDPADYCGLCVARAALKGKE